MTTNHSAEYLSGLAQELRHLPHETEWVEFKESNSDPRMIGQDIAALANGAVLHGREKAYMLWGIEDGTHAVVGTNFAPGTAKGKGNEPLENWLLRGLTPHVDFRFYEVPLGDGWVVIMEIDPATQQPVAFNGERFIRVGSVTKNLKEHPEKERALWSILERVKFESGIAAEMESGENVLSKLNYQSYFDLLERPIPESDSAILDMLERDELIAPCDAGGWNITNLGAILFANNLDDFRRLRRKAVRVVQYKGSGPTEILSQREGTRGYAYGFQNLLRYINGRISSQVIGQALRKTTPMVPEPAVRELVANALIHQDFFATGTGPMVEIYDTRIEITNPGNPLVDPQRFLGSRPTSRNEALAFLTRRIGMCEELGSGIPRVVSLVEASKLPAPLFESMGGFTRAVVFAYKELSDMDRDERLRACYLHAGLRYVLNQPMNNASLRERFGIAEQNAATASGILREAVDAGYITIRNPNDGYRSRVYLPYWASRREIDDQVL